MTEPKNYFLNEKHELPPRPKRPGVKDYLKLERENGIIFEKAQELARENEQLKQQLEQLKFDHIKSEQRARELKISVLDRDRIIEVKGMELEAANSMADFWRRKAHELSSRSVTLSGQLSRIDQNTPTQSGSVDVYHRRPWLLDYIDRNTRWQAEREIADHLAKESVGAIAQKVDQEFFTEVNKLIEALRFDPREVEEFLREFFMKNQQYKNAYGPLSKAFRRLVERKKKKESI